MPNGLKLHATGPPQVQPVQAWSISASPAGLFIPPRTGPDFDGLAPKVAIRLSDPGTVLVSERGRQLRTYLSTARSHV